MKFFSKNKEPDDIFQIDNAEIINEKKSSPENPDVLTVEEVLRRRIHKPENARNTGALDALKKRMLNASGNTEAEHKENSTSPSADTKNFLPKSADKKEVLEEKSLLEKCRPFIVDEQGKDSSQNIPPAYKLESVADILKKDRENTVDRFNQKYDFETDYLGKYVEKKLAEDKIPKKAEPVPKAETEHEKPLKTISTDGISLNDIKNAQTNVAFTISDIDPLEKSAPIKEKAAAGATITFTPIANGDTAPVIMVSSKTQPVDLTGEIAVMEDISSNSQVKGVELEKSDFDDYVPQNEIKSEIDSKRFLRIFSIKKRNYFLASTASLFLTFLLIIMKMPFMTGAVLAQTRTTMIICTVLLGLIAIANGDMFLSLPNLLKRRCDADVTASLSALFVLAYGIFGVIKGEIITDPCLLCGISITLRAIGKLQKYSYLLSNLKVISKKSPKKAIRLLSDTAVTYAIAKNSIDGDALIAAPQESQQIEDYIKYSTYGRFLNGKLPIITTVSIVLSALTFLAATKYFDSMFYGLYAAAAVQCFTSLPALFLIDNLPMFQASKKLNRQGAMISGKAGAEHIELANAIVLNSDDLFPEGTVSLHNMKILSENNVSDTVLRAASLTRELSSPLYQVFKEIAGRENMQSLPACDTVKYEDKMGISGWVNNELLFIGNRTIMEAHGIGVPDIETDRKILRSGCFPVYVASGDTAVMLLSVQYSVDPTVAKELHNLTKIGVTLLINNTDPNLISNTDKESENQMICDYLGLYEDSVMIMSTAGTNMYKTATIPTTRCSAPAAFSGRAINIAKILNCANRIRRSNTALTVMYILSAVLGVIMFAYSSFTSADTLIGGTSILLYSLISTLLTIGIYLIQKP